jgi:hypothetical protein
MYETARRKSAETCIASSKEARIGVPSRYNFIPPAALVIVGLVSTFNPPSLKLELPRNPRLCMTHAGP